jgi:hypothetical protein
MTVDITALVVRDKRDNHIISVDPLEDVYSEISLAYTYDRVSPSEIKEHIEAYMGKDHPMAIKASYDIANHGVWYDSQEAKDFSSVGNMLIGIETKHFEW